MIDASRFEGRLSVSLCPILKNRRHAFATWIIKDESYVAGALILGSSLRFHSPGISRVCLLSKDLDIQEIVDDLKSVYDWVVLCDLIYGEGRHPAWKRFEHLYTPWLNFCFTRLQCLRLGKGLGFDKVLIFDADCLVVEDLSELFDLPTPAGCLSLSEDSTFDTVDEQLKKDAAPFLSENGRFCHALLHGRKIPKSLVQFAVETNYGIRGSLLLLKTSEDDFVHLINILKSRPTTLKHAIGSYGDEQLHIGPDERLLTETYQELYGWTHIHQRYCMTAWHLSKLRREETPKALHFVSKKPWDSKGEYFNDFDLWYLEALNLVSVQPRLQARFRKSFLRPKKEFYRSSKSLGHRSSHKDELLRHLSLHEVWGMARTDKQSTHLKEQTEAVSILANCNLSSGRFVIMPPHVCYLVGAEDVTEKSEVQGVKESILTPESPERDSQPHYEVLSKEEVSLSGALDVRASILDSSGGGDLIEQTATTIDIVKSVDLCSENPPATLELSTPQPKSNVNIPKVVKMKSDGTSKKQSTLPTQPLAEISAASARPSVKLGLSSRLVAQTMRSVYAGSRMSSSIERISPNIVSGKPLSGQEKA